MAVRMSFTLADALPMTSAKKTVGLISGPVS